MRKISRWKAIRWAALAIVLCVSGVWVYRRTNWSKGFSPDGVLVLVGGAIAYFAALCQIDAEKQARKDEQLREAQSVAVAVTFEMDSIYRFYIRDVGAFFEANRSGPILPEEILAKRIENRPFPVYQSIAGRLGVLEPPLVAAIVHFYGGLAAHLMTLEKISATTGRTSIPEQAGRATQELEALIEQCRGTIPHLENYSREAFQRLRDFTEIPSKQLAALSAGAGTNAQTN